MGSRSVRRATVTAALAVGAVLLSVLTVLIILYVTAAAGNQSSIAGDQFQYAIIAAEVFDGAMPYRDVSIEHLPGSVIPMVGVEAIARVTGSRFELLWPFAMGIVFVISVTIAEKYPTRYSSGRRFIVLSLPLLPLVLFRVEPWLVLWVVAGVGLALRSAWKGATVVTFVGALTKGWPIVLFALGFRVHSRRFAVIASVATFLVLVVVALLPGFREGRAFEGIHTETVVGNLLLVSRALTGLDLQLIGVAGATYTQVGGWAVALNALVGLPFLGIAALGIMRRTTVRGLIAPIGLAVTGIIIASPLFSSQFVYWLVPFVLFLGASRRRMYLVTAAATLVTIILWAPLAAWWHLLVLVKNAAFLTLSVSWACDVNNQRDARDVAEPELEDVA